MRYYAGNSLTKSLASEAVLFSFQGTKKVPLAVLYARTLRVFDALDNAGVYYDEDPPVPIPNTEVKLISADNT